MMTVNRYADLVSQILDVKPEDMASEWHEMDWVTDCFNRGFPPSICASGLANWPEFYEAVMQQEDEQLRRAA